jgi:hypothetical protein
MASAAFALRRWPVPPHRMTAPEHPSSAAGHGPSNGGAPSTGGRVRTERSRFCNVPTVDTTSRTGTAGFVHLTGSTGRSCACSPCSNLRCSPGEALPRVRNLRQVAVRLTDDCASDYNRRPSYEHAGTDSRPSPLPRLAVYRMAATAPSYARPEIV